MKRPFCVLIILALVTLALTIPNVVSARTWLVNTTGTGDAPTIQAGIDSAAAPDTVLLADGTFSGPGNRDIDFSGKAITVMSESGVGSMCIISCGGTSEEHHRGFLFENGETQASSLLNLTITGGYRDGGGAIACYYTSPSITNCYFMANASTGGGGGMDMVNSSAVITCCVFAGNEATYSGGAIYMEVSSPTISGCVFSGNTSGTTGGGVYCYAETPSVSSCMFLANSAVRGGGIYLDGDCTASITSCTFWNNHASQTGGGLRCGGASPTITDCTFAADSSGFGGAAIHLGPSDAPGISNTLIAFSKTGSAVHCDPPAGSIGLICCNIYGNEGGDWTGCIAVHSSMNGNLSSDPFFCDLPTGDLSVETCSPCLAGNNTCGVNIGSQAAGCSCGEATEPATWGAIKAMYR